MMIFRQLLQIWNIIIRQSIIRIHPTPPVPQENPESTERDAEILLVGEKREITVNLPLFLEI
jgi:hypothetical protein